MTEVLGITKYSKTIEPIEEKERMPKNGVAKYKWLIKSFLSRIFPWMKKVNRLPFPTNLVSKTDETRIQNMPWVIPQLANQRLFIREKLDGSSITIIHQKKRTLFGPKRVFRVCSRNYELLDTKNEWYKVFEETHFDVEIIKLRNYYETNDIIIQGEYVGKPQGNPYKLKSNEIRVFNIIVNGKQLSPIDFYIATKECEIPTCPLLTWSGWEKEITLQELLEKAEGKSLLNPDTEREGVVVRDAMGKYSFKIISNQFLLNNKE
jgi:hypothetical protein